MSVFIGRDTASSNQQTVINPLQHSRYWIDKDIWNDMVDADGEVNETDRIFKLAAIRRAISNFVTILCGRSIPVNYSSNKDSYTDGRSIVISADDSPEKFDVMVGLALHEASHIMLTDFSFVKSVAELRDAIIASGDITGNKKWGGFSNKNFEAINIFSNSLQSIICASTNSGQTMTAMIDDLHTIMNILEDRRIDKFVYTSASGYRSYYDTLYQRYFYTEEISKNLRFNPEWREITIQNYINRLLLCFNPHSDPSALPGLKKLIRMLDLETIERVGEGQIIEVSKVHLKKGAINWIMTPTFDHMPVLWKDANKIYAHILKFASLNPKPVLDMSRSSLLDVIMGNPSLLDGEIIDISDEVFSPTEVEKSRYKVFDRSKVSKELNQISILMENKLKKKITKESDIQSINAVDDANAEMVDVKVDNGAVPSVKCIVTRKLTMKMMSESWFPFGNSYPHDRTERAIIKGKRLGQLLVHRLQVRNNPVTTKQIRLDVGNLDRRMLYQLGMDIQSVFYKSRTDSFKPAMLHLTLDGSGSMCGEKWEKVATVAVALAYASSKISNIDVVITIRGGNGYPLVSVVYDSRKDTFSKFINLFKYLSARGSTPEGLAFSATMNLILESKATHDVYFVNFSDGEPMFPAKNGFYYSGDKARTHTAKIVDEIRNSGINILSYFIYDSDDGMDNNLKKAFTKMYASDAAFVDIQQATTVITTLNKLLLNRGA